MPPCVRYAIHTHCLPFRMNGRQADLREGVRHHQDQLCVLGLGAGAPSGRYSRCGWHPPSVRCTCWVGMARRDNGLQGYAAFVCGNLLYHRSAWGSVLQRAGCSLNTPLPPCTQARGGLMDHLQRRRLWLAPWSRLPRGPARPAPLSVRYAMRCAPCAIRHTAVRHNSDTAQLGLRPGFCCLLYLRE